MSPAKKNSIKKTTATKKKTKPKTKVHKIPVRNLASSKVAGKKEDEAKIEEPLDSEVGEAEAAEDFPIDDDSADLELENEPTEPEQNMEAEDIFAELDEADVQDGAKKDIAKDISAKSHSGIYKKIALFFLGAALVLFVLTFYFSFGKLNITITPQEEDLNKELSIKILDENSNLESSQFANSLIGVVENIEIEEEKTYESTGSEIVGEEISGKVKIINNNSRYQRLVATTRLLSPDNKLYRIKETIDIPAGGSVEVAIYADEVVPENAITPTRFTIPGLNSSLQEKIYAESEEKFIYEQQSEKYIEQIDINNSLADIKKALVEKAGKKLGVEYNSYGQIVYKIDDNSISTEIDSQAGEKKDNFTVKMKANVVVVAFDNVEASAIAQEKIALLVPSEKKLIDFDSSSIEYVLEEYNLSQGSAVVKMLFSGTLNFTKDAQIIDRSKIIGLNQEQLEDYLDNFSEIKEYTIEFIPSFIKKAPKLIDRIDVRIMD